jgi:hypothetical protein
VSEPGAFSRSILGDLVTLTIAFGATMV